MAENFLHLPDSTIFHGVPGNPNGYSFGEARTLVDDDEKLKRLKERLDGYYINGLKEIDHPFIKAIMTCVGLEVLGQVVLGFDLKGESIEDLTIGIYEMLDPSLSQPLTNKFKDNYNKNRNVLGEAKDFAGSFTSYARVVRKGLRNSFTHNYRSLGIFLSDSQNNILEIVEDEGIIIINPEIFKQKYIDCYELCYSELILNQQTNYRSKALNYFHLLIR